MAREMICFGAALDMNKPQLSTGVPSGYHRQVVDHSRLPLPEFAGLRSSVTGWKSQFCMSCICYLFPFLIILCVSCSES